MHRSLTLITSLIVIMTTVALRGQQPPSTESAKAQAKGETKAQTSPKTKGDEPAKEKEKAKTVDRRGACCYPSSVAHRRQGTGVYGNGRFDAAQRH